MLLQRAIRQLHPARWRGQLQRPSSRGWARHASDALLNRPLAWSLAPSPRQRTLAHQQINSRRGLITDSLPTFLVPPVIFIALFTALWTYKVVMTIVFQNKIIYIPYMPPLARHDKIEDYASACRPVIWEVEQITSLDGVKLAVCYGRMAPADQTLAGRKEVVVIYFQGNGGSTPMRLPLLSGTLRALARKGMSSNHGAHFTMVAPSYRGFWRSKGRASQKGIEMDAQAVIHHISSRCAARHTQIVLWGQSLGAGVAVDAAARYLAAASKDAIPVSGIVLETPFTSLKAMLLALYPQKWLPYRYLWPFLRNHWDSEAALRRIEKLPCDRQPRILLVGATRDEVVPRAELENLEALCRSLNLETQRRDVVGALHTDATIRQEGQEIVSSFVIDVTQKPRQPAAVPTDQHDE